jgi:hypothetical protein
MSRRQRTIMPGATISLIAARRSAGTVPASSQQLGSQIGVRASSASLGFRHRASLSFICAHGLAGVRPWSCGTVALRSARKRELKGLDPHPFDNCCTIIS